jgi:diaminopimelate epimerase
VNFVKVHGLGNDFAIFESASWEEAAQYGNYASYLCDRHFGIGADGILVVGPDTTADVFMRIFNSDGSEPEMCGNGIRCAARFVFQRGKVPGSKMSIRTQAGVKFPEVISNGSLLTVRVDMGEPILTRNLIPMQGEGSSHGIELQAAGNSFTVTGVSMGNPHCIIFVDDIDSVPVDQWGPAIENHPLFPAKTNVEFVQVLNRKEAIMRVWERGAGITLACGTGTCAAVVGGVINGKTDRSATVHLLGGDLFIEWDAQNNHVYMTGPAVEVYSGQIDLTGFAIKR